MIRKALLTGVAVGMLGLSAPALFAADNPLVPSYKDAATKKYIMEFCNLDINSDGFLSAAEYLKEKNPLQPGWEQNPKYSKKLVAAWKAMAAEGDKVTMEAFMAYQDSNNPLSPNYKKP